MFKSISNWWNKDKIRLQVDLDNANQVFARTQTALFDFKEFSKKELDASRELIKELTAEVVSLKAAHPDMKAEGVLDPWFIIEVNGENPLKGLKIKIDWNEAAVQHMKDKGHTYKNEDVMMQHFVAQLYEHVIMTLENRVVDESDIIRPGEFE